MPRKFVESLTNAARGLRLALRSQRNMVIHTFAGAFVLLLAVILQVSALEMALLVLVIASVIVLELLNTAIEEIVNMLSLRRKMRAMVAKDVSAAAVLVSAMASVAIGLLVFVPRIMDLLEYWI